MLTETYVGDYSYVNSPDTKLGQGTYANVYKGKHRFRPDEVVAIKAINFDEKSTQDQKYLKQEISVMIELNHPNTIKMFTHQKLGPIVYLVMEYCSGRDLRSFLDKQPGKRLAEDIARNFMCQITSGLRYLHEKGIIHRDLKPQNILLSEDSHGATLKICDFGFARFIEAQMTSILGSPLYMAPEIMMGRSYTAKSDLWSVGCIFFEMLAGSTPLKPNSMVHLRQLVSDANPIVFPPEISNHCKDLIHGLLQKKSSDRLDWNQFLSHPYLQRNEPHSKQSWLQHIYVFSPHGSIITLYLKPLILISAVKGALQNLTRVPINEHLLIDNDGQVLQDNMPLEFYRFDQIEKPIYSIFWPHLRGERVSLPTVQLKYEIPFPNTLPESDLSLNVGSVNSLNDLQKIRDFWKFIASEFHHRYKNIKSRLDNVREFKFQHDYQQEVYKVVRYHSFRVGNDLNQQFRSVRDLFEVTKKSAQQILTSFNGVIEQLRNTKVHPALIGILNAQTLLQIVDEKKSLGYYQYINNEFKTIENNITNINTLVNKNSEAIDIIDRTKLDDFSLKELENSVTTLEAILSDVKTNLNTYNDSLKRTAQQLNDVRSSPSNVNAKNGNYDGVIKPFSENKNKITSNIISQDTKSMTLLETAQKAKVNCTLAMLKNLELIGKFLTESPKILKEMNSIREAITKIQPLIIEIRTITKLPILYKDYVTEIIRRKKFNDRITNFVQTFQTHIQSELKQELIKRSAFYELNGNTSYLKPLSIMLNKTPPNLTTNLSSDDISLPNLGDINTLDDDFCFIEEGTTEEKLKRVEKEKGELSEILASVTKELTTAKQTIEHQSKQITSLSKQFSFTKEVPSVKPEPQQQQSDLNNLKEGNTKLTQEIQSLKKRNQILVSEIDESSQKIKQLEQRLSQMEINKPEIKSLLDMGFSMDLVRKAFATTTTVEGALQWLLESSKV